MATVHQLLPGLNQREKMPSFILEGSRHRTSSRPSRKLSFSGKNVIFDENLWVFEKNFELKIITGKFYIMFTKPILDIFSRFKIGVSLAIHSIHILYQFIFKRPRLHMLYLWVYMGQMPIYISQTMEAVDL